MGLPPRHSRHLVHFSRCAKAAAALEALKRGREPLKLDRTSSSGAAMAGSSPSALTRGHAALETWGRVVSGSHHCTPALLPLSGVRLSCTCIARTVGASGAHSEPLESTRRTRNRTVVGAREFTDRPQSLCWLQVTTLASTGHSCRASSRSTSWSRRATEAGGVSF